MVERQIVGAAIRIFGLWRILITGLSDLYVLVASHIEATPQLGQFGPDAEKVALLNGIFNVVVGIAVIMAAPAIVRMIYRDPSPEL